MMKNGTQNLKSTMKYLALAACLGLWGACGGDESASEQDQKDAEAMAVPEKIDPAEAAKEKGYLPPGSE
tara:strand:- start:564 stop:770 length:207 start_codon:yes stop_codon:yes gene_type:complete